MHKTNKDINLINKKMSNRRRFLQGLTLTTASVAVPRFLEKIVRQALHLTMKI